MLPRWSVFIFSLGFCLIPANFFLSFVVHYIFDNGRETCLSAEAGIFMSALSTPYGGFASVWSVNAPTAMIGVSQRVSETTFFVAH